MKNSVIGIEEFNDINLMVNKFKSSKLSKKVDFDGMDECDFMALIYNLQTSAFSIIGASNKGFLRYFLISGSTAKTNLPMAIIDHLSYGKKDFISLL